MLRLETSEDRGTARRLSSLAENVICIGITRMLQTGIALGISLFERRQPRHSNRASLDPDLLRGNANPAIAFAYKFRSEEHTSELQSLMRNSYAVFCLKQKHQQIQNK